LHPIVIARAGRTKKDNLPNQQVVLSCRGGEIIRPDNSGLMIYQGVDLKAKNLLTAGNFYFSSRFLKQALNAVLKIKNLST
jgi:hypothetical protein